MDTPKRPFGRKLNTKTKAASNTDGFIGSKRLTSRGPLASNLTNFKKLDGFHSNQNQPITTSIPSTRSSTLMGRQPMRAADGRIVLDMPDVPGRPTPKRHRLRKVLWRTSWVSAVAIVLVAGGVVGKVYWKSQHIFKGGASGAAALQANVDPAKLRGEGDGRVNILLLGKGGQGHDGPDLTDTILIASVDPIQKEAALLSIPRDLYVKSNNGQTKINAVYANAKNAALDRNKRSPSQAKEAEDAGLGAVQSTVEQVTGIPIHYNVMVDFEAFRKAIDTVGGVNIDVKQALYDPTVAWENKNNPLIAGVGLQTFNGTKALLYARSRHGSARGDFDRAERQREILLALKSKVLSLGTFSNPLKINQLINAFGDHVQTNLSTNEVGRIYAIAKDLDSSKVKSIGLADPPNDYVTTGNINGLSIVQPRAGLFDYSQIQSYVRNVLKDGYLRNENASIVVLNGTTTPGLASTKATELKSFGYTISQVADAPTKAYDKTALVDLRNGTKKYTQHYLEQRLGTIAVKDLPDKTIIPGNADFVIILGRDAAKALP